MEVKFYALPLLAASIAWGQSLAEHAIITGSSVSGAAAASKTGKAAKDALSRAGSLLQAPTTPAGKAKLNAGQQQRPARAAAPVQLGPAAVDLRADFNPEDVKPGMTRQEVTAVVGAPSLTITLPEANSEQLV